MSSKFSTFISSFNSQTKGKQFEVFVKWFLENDPVWKSEVDKVWMWNDYPDRWGKDCGIDLVFKDKNDEVWAVQAKCYDREYPVTKSDVDKFLSESNRSLIQRRLLIATTDILGPNARKVCADQEKPVTLFLYSDFEDSAIDYPETISDLSRAKLKPKPKPRDHQTEAIEKVTKGFKDANKGQLIMACGTGKTFTTLWIKEKLKAELTLILLPSLSLLSQTLKEWTFGMNTPFKSLAVCSDETVTKGASEDRLLESVQDLSFPVTSDPSLIADFLNSSGNRVVFSTYQSSRLIADAQKKKNISSFDLAIADEAHRCAGNVSSAFTTILNGDLIKTKLKLFTTATPRTYSSNLKKQAEDLEFEIAGMDDEKVFGKEFHRLSFGEAIDRKLLTDYQLVIIGVDEPMIAELIKHRELLKTDSDEIIDAKSLAAEIGLIKAIKDYKLTRVISFHSRVKSAENFSKELPQVLDLIDSKHKPKGKIATGFVSGTMPTNYRRQKLEQLKELSQGDYAVLSNARCLSEGVDVPALDGIAIIDPKASQIDIVQTVGRAIRLSDNKSVGTILLPVFIENGDDPELSIESTNFKPVWDVLKALRSHDEMLAFELDTLRTEMGRQKKRTAHVGGLKKIVIDVPTSVDRNFSGALRTHLVEKTTASWYFWFGLIITYIKEKKVTVFNIVADDVDEQGYRIGQWLNSQRSKKNILSKEQIDKLESLAGWTWNKKITEWEIFKKELILFVDEFRHARPDKKYISKSGYPLGQRVANYRNNKSPEKSKNDFLEALPGWVWDLREYYWQTNYDFVLNFAKKEGNLKISRNIRLGPEQLNPVQWMELTKKYKRDNELFLSSERIKLCEKIPGWFWETAIDKNHEEGLKELKKYIKENGHPFATKDHLTETGFTLGSYLLNVRDRKRKETLSQEEIDQFELLPYWDWNAKHGKWFVIFSILYRYSKKYLHANPKINEIFEDYEIGGWVRSQKKQREILSSVKIHSLESLCGWTWENKHDSSWQVTYEKVIKAKKDNERFDYQWTRRQREKYREGKLSNEQISLCEKIPNWKW